MTPTSTAPRFTLAALIAGLACIAPTVLASDGNRLADLDSGADPYHPGLGSPRLVTPQWVGEPGVEAVVVLAIDDMTDNSEKYESYLRPILDRLKQIDGRAPVSIMTCRIDPADPQTKAWIEEGLSIEVHTLSHPCPLLNDGNFLKARADVHGGIDLLAKLPGGGPVAFRMPCCDSLNTPSPRFYAHIFNTPSPDGHVLAIDSSVFNITTAADPDLPRDLFETLDGSERFRRYLPFPSFVNTIENYPYPYPIGNLCWEFPCAVPSDWEAQNVQGPNNPRTVEDMKAALDAVVAKQGVFNLVFHPHGWIEPSQIVELIDHAVARYGSKVKFLTFREAKERLDANALGGTLLRNEGPARPAGADNGVRLLDLDDDGHLDVVIARADRRETRRWLPEEGRWEVSPFPFPIVGRHHPEFDEEFASNTVQFGVVRPGRLASAWNFGPIVPGAWTFLDGRWRPDPALLEGLGLEDDPVRLGPDGNDRGVRLLDIEGDGVCELFIANSEQNILYRWDEAEDSWRPLPFALPATVRFVDLAFTDAPDRIDVLGGDAGLRLVDIDEDGRLDVVASDNLRYLVALRDSDGTGWSRVVLEGNRGGEVGELPAITSYTPGLGLGSNRGFFVHSRALWWQNEDTAKLPDLVDRRTFNDLLKDEPPRAKTPEASRASIHVEPGYRVELVAAEPLIEDPVAFDWSADGRLWVVEMGDYPLGEDGHGKPNGRVRVLEDTDGDGAYDRAATFLDGLSYPNGVMCWRGGVLISSAPDIFYAEDTDGDGVADVRRVLFTGFAESNPQHRVNGFDFGLDGWVYAADGESPGGVRSEATGEVIELRGRDVRFRPDDGTIELASGRSQFGLGRDDWGDWFGNNNSVWAWHVAVPEAALARNPAAGAADVIRTLDPDRSLSAISPQPPRYNDFDNLGKATSANSPTPYRDDLLGAEFARSLFVSEPVHNLVRRMVLEPDGATYRGRRAPGPRREFLASTDNWSRFTQIKTGPDGALWVADMYRLVIEHPEWITPEDQAKVDLRAGSDRGRIYRVVPVGEPARPVPRLDRLDPAELVDAMESPNGWVRDTCQRLLIHADDRAVAPALARLAASSPRPRVRAQALATLGCLDALNAGVLADALDDLHPEVRRLAAERAGASASESSEVADGLLAAADDPSPRVRLGAAIGLGEWRDPRAASALASLLRRDGADPILRAAALSAAAPHASAILQSLLASDPDEPAVSASLDPLFATLRASDDRGAVASLALDVFKSEPDASVDPWRFAASAAIRGRWSRAELAESAGDPTRAAELTKALARLLAAASEMADDPEADAGARASAIRALADPEPDAETRRLLGRRLDPREPPSVRSAALDALGRARSPEVAKTLLGGWKSYTPATRSAVLSALLGRAPWASELLGSLEDGCISPAEIGPADRRGLLSHENNSIRDRAAAVFAATTGDRVALVERYRAENADLVGDPNRGRAVFAKSCATCHRLEGEGFAVGPDLAALTDRSPAALLVAILDPNRALEPTFAEYRIALADGRTFAGLIAEESAAGLTLRRAGGLEDAIARPEIEEIAALGRSLMPEGLEADLPPDAMADLIAYLGGEVHAEARRPEGQDKNR